MLGPVTAKMLAVVHLSRTHEEALVCIVSSRRLVRLMHDNVGKEIHQLDVPRWWADRQHEATIKKRTTFYRAIYERLKGIGKTKE